MVRSVKRHDQREWSRADFTTMTADQRKEEARKIAAERTRRDITQEDLARLADLPARTVSNLENGRTPHAATLRKLADALDGSPRGKPDDTSKLRMLFDVIGPMYLQLPDPDQAQAMRDIVLLLGTALDRAGKPKTQDPEHP